MAGGWWGAVQVHLAQTIPLMVSSNLGNVWWVVFSSHEGHKFSAGHLQFMHYLESSLYQ